MSPPPTRRASVAPGGRLTQTRVAGSNVLRRTCGLIITAGRLRQPAAQLIEQTGTRSPHQVEHVLESPWSSVVGIGHIEWVGGVLILARRIELAQPPYLFARLLVRRQASQLGKVRTVHREDQIEVFEVSCPHLPGGALQEDPPGSGRLRGPLVRRTTDMPAAGAGGVQLYGVIEAGLVHEAAHHTLSGGRAADVPETDK